MQLILTGCSYAGKTTLAVEISRWMIKEMGVPFVRWHNHFVAPRLDRHMIVEADPGSGALPGKRAEDLNSAEDEEQIMGLRPSVLEQLQRHNVWRHLHPDLFGPREDTLMIDFYYADAVYAPLYYGYGEPGAFSDRRRRAREWEHYLLVQAPEVALVLVEASPSAIRERMTAAPRPREVLKPQDVETALKGFRREYDESLVRRRFALDTTSASPLETMSEFLRRARPHLTEWDLLRMTAARRAQA